MTEADEYNNNYGFLIRLYPKTSFLLQLYASYNILTIIMHSNLFSRSFELRAHPLVPKRAAHEAKLRGPFTLVSKLPPALNDDTGNLNL